ncbi:nitrite/sulfite reductase [Streptomyces sp. DSM 41972]|uniref:assimilatory sulfite reductase (ferredoxin) n=1 Tax=Streptomyces althioticus subsp. attaecolombicae TaxID=3075534 RepID=A0ABU3I196_9ACTN|nr:nitrite/sulfite reductase [Streptomyces sp. DSM 41972]SCD89905.1 sulfite reductase (ferredoxin) [Streptomyces sp. di50b]SCE12663.1 sulfite reductase (ferredoxin) [Streptomyces sp. di188]
MAATPQKPAAAQNPAAATARRKAGRHRGEGQWAAGHFTPLNGNEQVKKDDDGLNVRTRIETIYSKRGFDSIDPNDLRGRMRWWGLYTQRKPGIDGGKTAVLEPEELDDEYFMLRVRIDGGALTTRQLRVIGELSQEFARGTADITDRQNVQYHWIRIEDVPEIWDRLEGVGLSTVTACGDTPRVMIGSPVAGIAEDEIIDGTPALEEMKRRVLGNQAYSNLPRKFKTAISGSPVLDVVHEINDVAFVGVDHPEHGPGFDLWVGGGLSTNPKLGVRLGAWVPLEDVPDVYEGVLSVFRDHGYRRLRNRARLKFLVADWGAEKFRQVLEDEYLGRRLADGPAPAEPVSRWRDHIGVHRQKDGRFYVGFAPRVGRVDGATLTKIADVAEAHGSGRVRTTVEQKMIILDIEESQVESLVESLEALDLSARPSPFRRGTMACTGIEFCKLAIVETKARGASLIDELERRMPEFDEPITINLNGCPNACARIQVADIGLKGQLMLNDRGEQVEGYQVHLGGALGLEAGFGRKVRGLKVTADELPDYVERVLKRFEAEREDGERFASWATRASEEALS